MKNLGVALILCGVALVAYNLFNFEPSFQAIGSRGMYYSTQAKLGIAAGAVLIVAGAFIYKRDQRTQSPPD